ncbi:ABC transporter permease [Virgibacillus sp. AGTR]|uniref:ABC transporter permease n=2 Tax=Virgibacillus salarius TaxID=447199 RepID=A0A941IAY4_9BACI|nr:MULTISPECIES: ABC transporter permease [Virgibacillus]MBR7797148.1 ABC transporter permease [Virgibacillus salarius]MCC2249890.1 ABC transporter permease [Virgibacillus sp. AGTR]NAZ09857.1 ABC transporter permease [Agaribacter marinus]QRZ18664.1 ABC transporter permease [Virgibacillus sp. AGTR]
MRNTMKVAKWEIKRNLKNKTFIIGMFLTPVLIIGFMLLGNTFGGSDTEETQELTTVFINDQLQLFSAIEDTVKTNDLPWELKQSDLSEEEVNKELEDTDDTAYLFIDQRSLEEGVIRAYTSEEIPPYFINQAQIVAGPLQTMQMKQLGLTEEELATLSRGVSVEAIASKEAQETVNEEEAGADPLKRIVPGAFAGFIMLSIVFTGMAIFQSASQEKKDKIAEIILSSLTPADLMQGKIIGYFVLGLIQAVVSITLVLPIIAWRVDISILQYLLVPELAFYIAIAILGYLLFASIFVGVGATMADVSTAGNFQGMVMMLPFLPFIFIGPVLSDPNGFMAQIGSYIPFTSPGVLLLRLTSLEEWPWMEIAISLTILIISVWFFMKLAGKIFKVGILMYGKNATPAEIWKWIRA